MSIVDVENHHLAPEPRGFLECPWRTCVIYHLAAEPRVLVDTTRTSGEWRLPDTSGKITVSTLSTLLGGLLFIYTSIVFTFLYIVLV